VTPLHYKYPAVDYFAYFVSMALSPTINVLGRSVTTPT